MNRCIECVNYKIVVIWQGGRYKGCRDGFCALHKKLIDKDGCCETWQKRKIDQDLYEQKHISVIESPGLLVMDFDELLKK